MTLRARDAAAAPGQVVDVSLYEGVFRILDELAPAYDLFGKVRQRMGAAAVNVVPHSHYPTGDGRWVAIACTSDEIFARFCETFGRPELAAPERFATVAQREAARAEVDVIVTDWTRGLTRDAVLAACERGRCPAARSMPSTRSSPTRTTPRAATCPVPRAAARARRGTAGAGAAADRDTRRHSLLGPALDADAPVIVAEWLGKEAAP